jgi:hypothetical protein
MGSAVYLSDELPMVRKSKRKQTIIAFEKNVTAVPINLEKYQLLISRYSQPEGAPGVQQQEEKEAGTVIYEILELLSDCETQKKQIKILQDKKNILKVNKDHPLPLSPSHLCLGNLITTPL